MPKFGIGDNVRVMNMSGMDFHGKDAPIGKVIEIMPLQPDVGVFEYLVHGKMNDFFAYEDELRLC